MKKLLIASATVAAISLGGLALAQPAGPGMRHHEPVKEIVKHLRGLSLSDAQRSAKTKQSNSMSGSITVYVTGITPAGNLLVTGEKWITMNRGKEYIRFSGEVRKKDVDESNTVLSSKVGNALIEYSGTGELQDNQQRTVIGKLFSIFG
jgi:flagellar basal body L-ring protein FlgH